ncbi:MAG TPA: response regulator transcription factor [Amycolatopsis sp.]|uniref:response regulator transcription factor n=1 Tax=Amycolatopsis sp. TaxID=37632 RepID=UPI002B486D7E|nr:response regulator transcription factor [Amycolatopsis sp.]HKS44896.1 response regulator transcription factor [Amycolatopsis sp.]
MDPLRVLVVDDHPMFRFGLAAMLEAEPEFTVVGEAADGQAAVRAAEALKPEVVVMDLHLPDISGVEAARRIVAAVPGTGVLMLTMSDETESVFAAMRAGARGYLLKGAQPEEIVHALRSVGRGEAIFGPDVATHVLGFFSGAPVATSPVFPQLTAREREVLDLLAAGRSNADIAKTLFLSQKTVRNHISNVFGKLQVADRAQAIIRAREAGLGQR